MDEMKYTSQADLDALIAAVDEAERKKEPVNGRIFKAAEPGTVKGTGPAVRRAPVNGEIPYAADVPAGRGGREIPYAADVPSAMGGSDMPYAADIPAEANRGELPYGSDVPVNMGSGDIPYAADVPPETVGDDIPFAADLEAGAQERETHTAELPVNEINRIYPDGQDPALLVPNFMTRRDEEEQKKSRRKRSLKGTRRIIYRIFAGVVAAAAFVYILGVILLNHRFLPNTTVNGLNYSEKSMEQAVEVLHDQYRDRTLTLTGKDGTSESISFEDFGYKLTTDDSFEELASTQNRFLWPVALFQETVLTTGQGFVYDQRKLRNQLEKLNCFASEEITDPVDARIERGENGYQVVPSSYGTRIDEEKLLKVIDESLTETGSLSIDLEAKDCYLAPEVPTDDPAFTAKFSRINTVQQEIITLNLDGWQFPIDKTTFLDWMTFDDSGDVSVSRDAVRGYVNDLADRTDTFGQPRGFRTTSGEYVDVGGGYADTYGYKMNRDLTAEALAEALESGATQTVNAIWLEEGATRATDQADIGYTYIEVSISAQHLWYYVDGELALETDVTTGMMTSDRKTPPGAYKILKKLQNYTMTTATYSSHTNYALRVNYVGIYIHDSPWRSRYGGTYYINGGSHGCVNTPYTAVENLFYMVEEGTPVLIY